MYKYRYCFLINTLLISMGALAVDTTVRSDIATRENAIEDNVVIPDRDLLRANTGSTPEPSLKELTEITPTYLLSHTDEFEDLLVNLLLSADVEALKTYLPTYQQVPNHDPSLIDWGEAIIASSEGNASKAISLYRKINAALPDLSAVRFQLAITLFRDKQFVAAKNEFQKLRSLNLPQEFDVIINQYLEEIAKQDEWDITFGASYVHDNNVNNAPPVGTKIIFPNGASVTSDQQPITAHGFNFDFSADKKWRGSGNWFGVLNLNTNGTIYWDEKSYNSLNARVGVGMGYSNALTEFELTPFFSHRWFVNKDENDNGFDHYSKAWGARASLGQFLSPQLKYQGAVEVAKNTYRDGYNHLNGNDYLFSNTLLYIRNPKQYWFTGLDLNRRDVKSKSNSYRRIGGRIGWGQEWNKGISTRVTFGLGKKHYDGIDFFAIKQKNTEYNLNVSVWNRDWHIWNITPRLTWRYQKVDGNHPFYKYDDSNVYLDFTKTF